MFESAELGQRMADVEFNRVVNRLRVDLLNAQFDLGMAKRFATVIVVGGFDGAGRGETVNVLNEWMDPRHIESHAFGAPTDEEAGRPPMWRYWRALPPRGRIGILFGSWYGQCLDRRARGKLGPAALHRALESIRHFERMLCDEGTLILKFWFHLSRTGQAGRLRELAKSKRTRWRVTREDWKRHARYDAIRAAAEEICRETSTGDAPWIVIDGTDPNYRSAAVGRVLLDSLRRRLDAKVARERRVSAAPIVPAVENVQLLRRLDLGQRLGKKAYGKRLERLQGELNQLTRHKRFDRHAVVLAFEGWDAAGKGGAIRRITSALDARHYRIVPIAAPSDEERAHPYLWRFWRHVPRLGGVTIFDRSWYGRVLVERVEGYCTEADWMRAYGEINQFEEELAAHGTTICKFWLHISPEEQLRRFREREKTPFKRFKITRDDWRNREKRNLYERAVCDMVDRTSTNYAPWTLVEADDKSFARVKILQTLVDRLEQALDRR